MKIQESNNVGAVPDTEEKLSKAEIKTTNHEKDNNVQVLNENETHSDNQETRDKKVQNLLKNKNEIDAVEADTINVDNGTEANENLNGNVQVLNGNKTHSDNQETRDKNVQNLLKNKNADENLNGNVQVLNGNKIHSDNQGTLDKNVENLLKNKNEIGGFEVDTANVDNRTEANENLNGFAKILANSSQNLDQPVNGATQNNNVSTRTSVASESGLVIQGETVTYSRNRNVRAPFMGAAIVVGAPSSDAPVTDPDEFFNCGRGFWCCLTGIIAFISVFTYITMKGGFKPKNWSNLTDNSTGDVYGENSTSAIGMANITEFGMNNITDIGMGNITEIMANSTTSAVASLVGDYTIWILGIMYAILHLVDYF